MFLALPILGTAKADSEGGAPKLDIMDLTLVEIDAEGRAAVEGIGDELADAVCAAMLEVYQKSGFLRPWVGYLARRDDQLVGSCGFKSPPCERQVEIAYFTFPAYEGQGIGTQMARQLVAITRAADPQVVVTAQTLPHENASTSILRKLGFQQTGLAHDDEVGVVWQWTLPSGPA